MVSEFLPKLGLLCYARAKRGEAMRRSLVTLVTILLVSPALAEPLPARPDNRTTPGRVWSTNHADICAGRAGRNERCEPGHTCKTAGSYSDRHRRTTAKEKQAAFDEYRIQKAGREFEIDHRIPLCLGGGDVPENRWPQKGWEHPSFHDKDRLETRLCRMVCGNKMNLRDAQAIFLGDWIGGFKKVYGVPPE